ncbi:hypothetical protein ACOMHN_064416 [Nucella lapillus]
MASDQSQEEIDAIAGMYNFSQTVSSKGQFALLLEAVEIEMIRPSANHNQPADGGKEPNPVEKKVALKNIEKLEKICLATLTKMPVDIMVDFFAIPVDSNIYSKSKTLACGFYSDNRCDAKFTEYSLEDKLRARFNLHIQEHIYNEGAKGGSFTTSSIQFRNQQKESKAKKVKKPPSPKPSPKPPRKAVRRKRAKTKDPEEEPPAKKASDSESISGGQNEVKDHPEVPAEDPATVVSVQGVKHLDHNYAARPGCKPKRTPDSPRSDVSSSDDPDVSGIDMSDTPPEDSQLDGHPFAARQETIQGTNSLKKKGKPKERVIPQEEKQQGRELLEKVKNNKKKTGKQMCTICPEEDYRTFTAVASLVNHIKSKHLGLKMFDCKMCDAKFTRRHSQKYHEQAHLGQFKYQCKHCDKEFRHNGHFEEHKRKHNGETPYPCEQCNNEVSFKTRNTYKRHLKTVHGILLTWRGQEPMTAEEFAKVQTKKRYQKSTPTPGTSHTKGRASPSASTGTSSSGPPSPATSAAPMALPPVGTILSGLPPLTPQPSLGVLPPGISSPFSQGPSYVQVSLNNASLAHLEPITLVQQPQVTLAYAISGPGVAAGVSSHRPDSQPSMASLQLVASTPQPLVHTLQSTAPQPATLQSLTTFQPATFQPATSQPATLQSLTTFQPASFQPVTSQPATFQSLTTLRPTIFSGTLQPMTPQPTTSQPTTFQPHFQVYKEPYRET